MLRWRLYRFPEVRSLSGSRALARPARRIDSRDDGQITPAEKKATAWRAIRCGADRGPGLLENGAAAHRVQTMLRGLLSDAVRSVTAVGTPPLQNRGEDTARLFGASDAVLGAIGVSCPLCCARSNPPVYW